MCNCDGNGASGGNTMAGLIIFILVILQFQHRHGVDQDNVHNPLFDKSTLFILVLFFVACCGKVNLGC